MIQEDQQWTTERLSQYMYANDLRVNQTVVPAMQCGYLVQATQYLDVWDPKVLTQRLPNQIPREDTFPKHVLSYILLVF